MQAADYVTGRRHGLDWLRIGAFGSLILYHIGMFFVSWDWHVQTTTPVEWLELPMLALNPWRLALLFLISGIASRVLLEKVATRRCFARERSLRLLVPLLAGMALFVAPQPWVELRGQHGYAHGLWHFWTSDYFRFGELDGIALPTWNHLWFVAYLWAYTMMLALLALAPAAIRAAAQRLFERIFGGWRLFAVPMLWLFATRMLLYPNFEETHALVDDPYAHSVYGFVFFFGVGLARSQKLWEQIVASWKPAAAAALAAYLVYGGIYAAFPGDADPSGLAIPAARAARSVQAWGAILALLGAAQLFLHRDGPARRYLTEAVFPYYIAHQTIIILAGYRLRPLGLGAATEFAILLAATAIGCALAFELARRSAWLRPLFGLKRVPLRRHRARVGVVGFAGKAPQEWEMYDLRSDPNEAVNLVEVAVSPPRARSGLPDQAAVQATADMMAALLAKLERRDL